MSSVFQKQYTIPASSVDRFNRLKASHLLNYVQRIAGDHCQLLGTTREVLLEKNLFWAVIRHRVQITRLPKADETITIETWPMPTTRTAFPRSCVAYDAEGNECFRSISLWVLMDLSSRALILPGKCDVAVEGVLRGCELTPPSSLIPKAFSSRCGRTVRFTDLDWNGHMNTCRYLDWVCDILPSSFHEGHSLKDFTICYLAEAVEGDTLSLDWELDNEGALAVNAGRDSQDASAGHSRVFAAKILFENGVL